MADFQTSSFQSFPPLVHLTDAASGTGTRRNRRRYRLLRNIQRISSSPSLHHLCNLGSRSSSIPYHGDGGSRSSLSCVSLIAAPAHTPLSYHTPPQSSLLARTSSSETDVECLFYDCLEKQQQQCVRAVHVLPASSVSTTCLLPADLRRILSKKPPFPFWDKMPHEICISILSYLRPKELVRTSRVSKMFYKFCFDGQLWMELNASKFYQQIPADSLARILVAAGPFIKHLNLRGCLQMEHYQRAEVIAKACRNLINFSLEGCRNFNRHTLYVILHRNENLVHVNFSGLAAVCNMSCFIVAQSCPHLESLNVSWCSNVDARGIHLVVNSCRHLRDVRACEIGGFNNVAIAQSIFRTNNLDRLVLSGSPDFDDAALQTMMHGANPVIDIFTGRPKVPPRKLRHLDISKCLRLTSAGVKSIGYSVPALEGLQVSGCYLLTDAGLEPILASTPRLTHLELGDLGVITDPLLTEHLIRAPCVTLLQHLTLSDCDAISDTGVMAVLQKCTSLRSCDLSNTIITDLVLAEAAIRVTKRLPRSTQPEPPKIGLSLNCYDCPNVTWMGVREVLLQNAQMKAESDAVTYPSAVVKLKCFFSFQMTVDEHLKRVLRGDYVAAGRLERKWTDYMQVREAAVFSGEGYRQRRRRVWQAHVRHLSEEDESMRRIYQRPMVSCSVM